MLKEVLEKDTGQFEYMTEPYTLLSEYTLQPSGLIFVGYRNKAIRDLVYYPNKFQPERIENGGK